MKRSSDAPRERVSPRRIALVGMRAAGKTTIGRLLAARLERTFLDLDQELVREAAASGERAGSAGELARSLAWPAFRELEGAVLARVLAGRPDVVLATGGGVVECEENRKRLKSSARVVWLDVPLEALRDRLGADSTDRPSLGGGDPREELEAVLARRERWYASVADTVIRCGERTQLEIASEIAALV